MPDYETLPSDLVGAAGALLIGFAIMDGFDLGVGATFRFIGRDDQERRALLECVEPVWEGNQVWFILGGARYLQPGRCCMRPPSRICIWPCS